MGHEKTNILFGLTHRMCLMLLRLIYIFLLTNIFLIDFTNGDEFSDTHLSFRDLDWLE